jgi:hypothetical protein
MSDGIHEASGSPLVLTVDDKQWFFGPIDRVDEGTIELEILSKRPKPLDVVKQHLASLGEEDRRTLLELAYRDEMKGPMVSRYDMRLWELTPQGSVFVAWLRLRHNHPDVTLDTAHLLLKKIGASNMLAAYKASDGRPRPNQPAPAAGASSAAAPTTGASPGEPSTEHSPESTESDQAKG